VAAVVADVGWRGTIQDNLCAVLPDTLVHGVYLGLFPYLNPQPVNARKSAVVFDGNLGEPYHFADPPAAVEAPWTPVVPSTVGYEAGADGVVRAVQEDEPGRAEHLLRCFADGVRLGAPVAARRMAAVGADTTLLRAGLQEALVRYYRQPEPGVADIWFDSAHDDTFGALNETPYAKLEPPRSLLWSPVPAEQLPLAAESRWAPGWAAWMPVRSLDAIRRARAEWGR
jgi:hypothetical protein